MDTSCADAFLAAAPAAGAGDRARIEARIEALHARLADVLPGGARVPAAALGVGLARSDALRAALLAEPSPAIDDEALREVGLVAALRRGEPGAAALFEQRYIAPLDAALARMRLSSATLDEVKQVVRARLLLPDPAAGGAARIEAYAGAGRLGALVRVAATRAALDLVRRARRDEGGGGPDLLDLPDDLAQDPALAALKARCQAEFREAFAAAVGGLESRARNLLRLHLLGGVTLEALAAMYGVHRATVVRWLADARRAVLTATRKALQARLEVRPDELDSLMRLAESGIDLSVERLLRSQHDAGGPGGAAPPD